MAEPAKTRTRSVPVMLIVAAVTLVATLGLLVAFVPSPTSSPSVRSTGQALVGGHFELVDHNRQLVTEETYGEKLMLMYFGFTFCPDVCPTQLLLVSSALEQLGDKADKIQPLFITVDPERDTPEVLAKYVEYFHPRMVGLTGTPEQIEKVTQSYYVAYSKVDNPDDPESYLMDHSSILYLMTPEGEYLTHFTHQAKAEDIAAGLEKYL